MSFFMSTGLSWATDGTANAVRKARARRAVAVVRTVFFMSASKLSFGLQSILYTSDGPLKFLGGRQRWKLLDALSGRPDSLGLSERSDRAVERFSYDYSYLIHRAGLIR